MNRMDGQASDVYMTLGYGVSGYCYHICISILTFQVIMAKISVRAYRAGWYLSDFFRWDRAVCSVLILPFLILLCSSRVHIYCT